MEKDDGAYTCDVAVVPVKFTSTVDEDVVFLLERPVCAFSMRECCTGYISYTVNSA